MKKFLLLMIVAGLSQAQILSPILFHKAAAAGCTLPSMSGVYTALFANNAVCTSGCTNGNANVTSITDASGNGHNYTSTANATYRTGGVNGLPVIDMVGTAHGTLGGLGVSIGDTSVLIVAKLNTTTGKQTVTSNALGAGSFAYYLNYSSGIEQGADNDLIAAIAGGTAAADLNYHQMSAIWTNNTSIAFRIDRANDPAVSPMLSSTTATIDEIGQDDTGIQTANYRWWAIVIFSSAINNTVRGNWETYFNCETNL